MGKVGIWVCCVGLLPLLVGRVRVLLTRWARRLGAVCRPPWVFEIDGGVQKMDLLVRVVDYKPSIIFLRTPFQPPWMLCNSTQIFHMLMDYRP